MRSLLVDGGRVYELLDTAEHVVRFVEAKAAREYIKRHIASPRDRQELRALLTEWRTHHVVAKLTDDEVLDAVAVALASGGMTLVERR